MEAEVKNERNYKNDNNKYYIIKLKYSKIFKKKIKM